MIALIALLIVGGWIALCVYLARRIPSLLHVRRFAKLFSVMAFLILLMLPAADHFVGMWQFERLCKERDVVWVGPEAGQVKRAKDTSLGPVARAPTDPAASPLESMRTIQTLSPTSVVLSGYWIAIESQPVEYSDADTGKPFYRYEILHTKGGRIVRLVSLDATYSCTPQNRDETSRRLNIDKLLNYEK